MSARMMYFKEMYGCTIGSAAGEPTPPPLEAVAVIDAVWEWVVVASGVV